MSFQDTPGTFPIPSTARQPHQNYPLGWVWQVLAPFLRVIKELDTIKVVAERGICSWRWSGWWRTELGQMLCRKGCFPPRSPSVLSTEPGFALAPAPGPEEMSAAGAHSCSPCSIYCFQFIVLGSWAGQHGGNMVMLPCAKPAWKKIFPSPLGWLPFPSLEAKPTRRSPGRPCGVGPGRGAGWCHNVPVFLGS